MQQNGTRPELDLGSPISFPVLRIVPIPAHQTLAHFFIAIRKSEICFSMKLWKQISVNGKIILFFFSCAAQNNVYDQASHWQWKRVLIEKKRKKIWCREALYAWNWIATIVEKIHLTCWETEECKNCWDQDKNLLCTTQQGASEQENGEYIFYM